MKAFTLLPPRRSLLRASLCLYDLPQLAFVCCIRSRSHCGFVYSARLCTCMYITPVASEVALVAADQSQLLQNSRKFKCANIARSQIFAILCLFLENTFVTVTTLFSTFPHSSIISNVCVSVFIKRKVRERLSTSNLFIFFSFMFEEVQRTHLHTFFSPLAFSLCEATNSFKNLRKISFSCFCDFLSLFTQDFLVIFKM